MRHRDLPRICRIDVTGLLAVMFVLLFIMMTPYFMWFDLPSWGADLPKASSVTPQQDALREDSIQVWVERDGTVLFGNCIAPGAVPKRIPSEILAESIREELRNGAPRKVFVRADRHASYGDVRGVLEQIQLAGVSELAFLAEQPSRLDRRSP